MKNKGLIVALSCMCIFVVALITTIIVLASGNQNVSSNLSLIYVASEIGGSVSGTYKVGDNPAKDMTNSSGAKVVNFGSDQPETLSLLSPNETLTMLYGEDVVLTYTFTNSGEEYYANMSYSDTATPYTNLDFTYKSESDTTFSADNTTLVKVPKLGSTTFSIKISIHNAYLNASLDGTVNWALTKDKPINMDKYVNLSIANNTGSNIDSTTFTYKTRTTADGKDKFKIVGATPVLESASAKGYINGSFDSRTNLSSSGKVSSLDDLKNSSGAEFFYFCTNPAVVGSTGYNDPGTIYYTSTSDSTLETWYDVPSSETQLYACFMVPNYVTEELYTGSDTQIIISNNVANIPFKAFYNNKTITDVEIPQSIKNIGYGTSNGTYGAFQGCSKLKSVTIPSSLTSIGNRAFHNCSSLTSITIPESVTSIGNYAFYSCEGLTSITIPNSVTSIGGSTFSYCSGLTNITIPDSVTSIGGDSTFSGCSALISITIPNSVTSIGPRTFWECSKLTSVIISSCIKSISAWIFNACSSLTSITIPDGVTSIGDDAFGKCTSLTSISTPDSLTSIGARVFSRCSNLTSITLPNSVKSIGVSAFSNCIGLTSITIPGSMTSIDNSAFYGCSGLKSIKVSETNTVYYSSGNCLIKKSDNSLILGCKTSVIPDCVTSITASAFESCKGLTSITIPNSVTSIGDSAFESCSSLTNVTIGNGVTDIGRQAFRNCISLTSVTIGTGVTNIGWSVISGCTGLTNITIPESVTSIGSYAFSSCSNLTSIVFEDTSKTWTVNSEIISVTDSTQNATYLTDTYKSYTWTKNS